MTPAEMARLHASAFSFPRPWTETEISDLSRQPGVFLITQAGGFVIGRIAADEAEVLTIAVHPDMQRRGIGRRLMAAFVRDAESRGAGVIHLEVAATNHPAIALYAACGFLEAGRRKGYYRVPGGAPIDAIVLSRRPAPGL